MQKFNLSILFLIFTTYSFSVFATSDEPNDDMVVPLEIYNCSRFYYNGLGFGFSSTQGKRSTMQDKNFIKFNILKSSDERENTTYFGLFDGHGGSLVASYLRDNLLRNILNEQNLINNETITRGFLDTNNAILQNRRIRQCGSCAISTFIFDDKIVVANAGTSRAIIVRDDGVVVPLSNPHNANVESERNRVISAGGNVEGDSNGTLRVCGTLIPSRAFGDYHRYFKMHEYVAPEPEIIEYNFSLEHDRFLIIASDGFWDYVHYLDDNITEILNRSLDPQKLSESLLNYAYQEKGSEDNITVIVVPLRAYLLLKKDSR
jgi:protein phosphatase PTC2/3